MIAAALLVPGIPGPARAVEDWADRDLPVTSGLELWLDASRLDAAAAARGEAPPRSRGGVAVWPDAGGRRRDAVQPAEPYRPLRLDGRPDGRAGPTLLRFDGINDHLTAAAPGLELGEFTLFLAGAPGSNAGGFRALISANRPKRNDYVSGFNVDLGASGSGRFETLNVEGAGFGGQGDLMEDAADFGSFHILTLAVAAGDDGIGLAIDGRPQGRRGRSAAAVGADEIRIGCRCYSNTQAPPGEQGFLEGDIAEVILYSRLLDGGERRAVEQYLAAKYASAIGRAPSPPEPPLRFLAPGFTVRELPVKVTNINYLIYDPEGRLFALGYDGRIHTLRDTDGDGLEDQVRTFWDEKPLLAPIAMAWRPEGLYVTSHGKVSLFRDGDGDGRADREEVVVEGWVQPDIPSGGAVDALGLTFDAGGNLFFGLGCADFTNAYRIRDGKAHYDIASERGTILRVSPDRRRREIFVTGIRFPFALAFNRHGDLFATDQEGETWLPGGNPLDELDHIIQGRHYGFPPRHPEHLPGVIDEPAVAVFSPQHQSTCGLVFNEARDGWKSFGPPAWEGDALVCGFSRGKIWRVLLVKTATGYIGKPILIASSRLMTLAAAVSRGGDLALTCHSGGPDWGTGPRGAGRLFKVSCSDPEAPQPVIAWAAGPLEARVAFDRPIDRAVLEGLPGSKIEHGEYVRAADRLEVHKPPYQVVQEQMAAPRGSLRIAAARLSDDGRTLVLAVDPHPLPVHYALALPSVRAQGAAGPGDTVDLAYDLSGVEGSWSAADGGEPIWSGWLPHLDLAVSRALTAGSAEHERLFRLLERPGTLRLRARVDPPAGKLALRLSAGASFEAEALGKTVASSPASGGEHRAELSLDPEQEAFLLEVALRTGGGGGAARLEISQRAGSDPTERPLPLERLHPRWAPLRAPRPPVPAGPPPELAGGDRRRGEAIFFGAEARCSACHRLRGRGGDFGPDLSNLAQRDAASVRRDIVDPSAVIHPDYVPYAVLLRDGRTLAGVVRSAGEDRIVVIDTEARETMVPRRDVRALAPGTVSIMPQGIDRTLGEGGLRDLLAFLLMPPLEAPPAPAGLEPPVRSRAEVEAALRRTAAATAEDDPRPLNLVLVAGPKDHGPGEHEYPYWRELWGELLSGAPAVRVSTADRWPDRGQWDLADAVIFYFWNHDWSEERYRDLDRFLARGGGAVFLHSAVIPEREPEKLAGRIGLAWIPGKTKYRHGALDLKVLAPADHPITAGLPAAMHFVDETYWPLTGEAAKVDILAAAVEEGEPQPILWTFERGKGRVFCSILGHYYATFDDPFFRLILLRGIAWAAREPAGRLAPLALDGVTVRD